MAERGTFLVPYLIAYHSIAKYGRAQGNPLAGLAKLDKILSAVAGSIELAMHSGVKIAYGSDLVKDPKSQLNQRCHWIAPPFRLGMAPAVGEQKPEHRLLVRLLRRMRDLPFLERLAQRRLVGQHL